MIPELGCVWGPKRYAPTGHSTKGIGRTSEWRTRCLFVCTGNICRSPAAERLLRRDLDRTVGGIAGLSGVHVSSAGTGALVGEPITPPMAQLVAGAGGDVERFSARQLTASIVRGADLVITMTSAHRRRDGHPRAGRGPADLRPRGDGAHARAGRRRRGDRRSRDREPPLPSGCARRSRSPSATGPRGSTPRRTSSTPTDGRSPSTPTASRRSRRLSRRWFGS